MHLIDPGGCAIFFSPLQFLNLKQELMNGWNPVPITIMRWQGGLQHAETMHPALSSGCLISVLLFMS